VSEHRKTETDDWGHEWMLPNNEEERQRFIAGRRETAARYREEAEVHESRARQARYDAKRYEKAADKLEKVSRPTTFVESRRDQIAREQGEGGASRFS
jgi:hypothetical protein